VFEYNDLFVFLTTIFLIKPKNEHMTIEAFKALSLEKKLIEIKYHGEMLGSYERSNENGGKKQPGDIFALFEFWVFLSDDEQTVVPTRRNPIANVAE
jgi:hypothetical protein